MVSMSDEPYTLRWSTIIDCPKCFAESCRLSFRTTWRINGARLDTDKGGLIVSIDTYAARHSLECHACGYSIVKNTSHAED